ncbi:MAG: UbiX family flavin prenyltransferase [Desulfurella sp.]|jgi:4-hydroxy-3-polyprenylbenzoate decarboxylase|uniref:Flavin prenyltransferase UbiX n=1 Tax=Desulfurella multipotens TaxID=79269 RepID=A0A1G6LPS4_9BACT|nr:MULTISPECIES: UbiX family flavin prenyltransferase [Desulfurella]AHF97029.1 aromatic acid decarboxylase [Desulfurella acetivorans A63]HEX13962.1 UbiX family flavin prenyltransferase [Desulfurella acetivorans]PMP65247.1 MAG: UbiX family flavin prenyltransferase [Desulfurella multipotens]PMP88504.1 MAG: UbiX family flavin prenyltransferase [Desulfurella sp.]SDC45272.1 4-hydroxy-3-polyprenylbenzoate decarboxylase [Desulfurella multipotens]
MKIVVGISGASGIIYARKLLEYLSYTNKYKIYAVASKEAINIAKKEANIDLIDFFKFLNIEYFDNDNFYSPIASGSFLVDKTIVIPCSVKTLASIACGFSYNLITRVCDIAIKERRTLTICPREMPFSSIHLENMLKLAKIGVNIAVPTPAFYGDPKTIDDLVNFVVGKVLDVTGIENDIYKRWK